MLELSAVQTTEDFPSPKKIKLTLESNVLAIIYFICISFPQFFAEIENSKP
jgi:hypothetical protein